METFKLLAIRPLHGCSRSILKILQPGEFYFFDQNYRPSKRQDFIERVDLGEEYIPKDFFYRKGNPDSALDFVNVQALVGKNGDGKSSLMELALRIFNNVFKAGKVHKVTKKLLFVKELNAELYFSLDAQVYRLSVFDDINDQPSYRFETVDRNGKPDEAKLNINQLFFVINVNYSHYSLNSLDFKRENFGKSRNAKDKPWLDRIFHRNDGYQTPITVHPFRTDGNIDVNRERHLITQRLINLVLTEESYSEVTENVKIQSFCFVKFQYGPLWNAFEKIADIYGADREQRVEINADEGQHLFDFDNAENQFFLDELLAFIKDWKPKPYVGKDPADYLEFQEYQEYLEGLGKQEHVALFMAWMKGAGRVELKKLGLMCRGVSRNFMKRYPYTRFQDLLMQYLAVKATKMLGYPQYEDVDRSIEITWELDAFEAFFEQASSDVSHISFKFKQVFQLLVTAKRFPGNELIKFYEEFTDGEERTTSKSLKDYRGLVGRMLKQMKALPDEFFFNPPPVFKNSLEVEVFGSVQNVAFSGISSGQFQKVGLISSIINHLKNIDSIQGTKSDGTNTYNKVLLILDEIELYFHPDFQRTFLNELLDRISKIKFTKVKAINILFVTHSPFILSDIPKVNVMFMENGLQAYPMTENTFGANIHTLLQHGFFLKGVPIGEFARNKINQLFTVLNNGTVEGEEDLEKRILIVSEPFLKSQLLKLYHERTTKVDELLKRIEDLERRLDARD